MRSLSAAQTDSEDAENPLRLKQGPRYSLTQGEMRNWPYQTGDGKGFGPFPSCQ